MANGFFGFAPNNVLGGLYLSPQTGNEARWRQALANQGSISKPRSSLGGRLENATVDTLRRAGVSDRTAARLGSKTFSAVNDLTPVGNLTGADEGAAQFGRGLTRGDLGQAALGAGIFGLSVFPGAAGRVVGKVGKGMFGRLMRDESGAIRAWHGSPHDFDKFSLSKIGTGEGAQAYGHGLYFAENPEVAKMYRDTLTQGESWVSFGGKRIANGTGLEQLTPREFAALKVAGKGGDPEAALADIESILPYMSGFPQDMHRKAAEAVRKSPDRFRGLKMEDEGRLYEVNINAEPQDFLDWETPYRAQPEPVRNALEPLLQSRFGSPDNPYRVGTLTENPDGQKLFRELKSSGGNWVEDTLRDNGVAGLRYLDQGSRVGGGTRNYVVFDDGLINILNKF